MAFCFCTPRCSPCFLKLSCFGLLEAMTSRQSITEFNWQWCGPSLDAPLLLNVFVFLCMCTQLQCTRHASKVAISHKTACHHLLYATLCSLKGGYIASDDWDGHCSFWPRGASPMVQLTLDSRHAQTSWSMSYVSGSKGRSRVLRPTLALSWAQSKKQG